MRQIFGSQPGRYSRDHSFSAAGLLTILRLAGSNWTVLLVRQAMLAKWQSMSACILEMPVVLRVSVGSKYGAQHSQDWCAIVSHIPGLQVVFPSTPYDAKGMLNTALAGSDPPPPLPRLSAQSWRNQKVSRSSRSA